MRKTNLQQMFFFDSPSAAAGFVGGASLNGKVKWIDDSGRTLKEIM